MTNILVTVTARDAANATSYLTTYRVDGYAGGMLPPRLPVNVGHYEDTFRRAGTTGCWQGGWPSSRSEARPSGCRRRLVTLAGNPALRTKLSHPLPRKIVTECRTAPG